MAWDTLNKQTEAENKADRDRKVAAWICVAAVLLAICSLGGSNATKDATLKTIEASNLWSFFQAKNIRRELFRVEIDQLELQVASNPQMPEPAKTATADKIKSLKAKVEGLTSDPKSNEGLDQLFARAKALEQDRDQALKRDPYFDYGAALLSIAIALASVALIAEGVVILGLSILCGAAGALLTFNGFTLLFPLLG
jgi:hypothetical protein